MIDCHTIIYETEMAQNFHHYYKTSKGKLSIEIKRAIINGLKHSAKDYALALDAMRTYSKNLDSIFERFDAIITPSSCGIADKGFKTTGSPEFNKIWSLAHVPCISLPILKGEKNLPLGVQIIGKQFEDLSMLNHAKIFNNS
jgi:Asp-tRNA(Asn)/Glu-tRNA(Gln) amidotransferase A subunit family amidase